MSRRVDMQGFWDRAARNDAMFYVDDRGYEGEEFWAAGEQIVARFESELGFAATGARVVEIGCGVGRLTRALAARASEVVALDISAEMLTLAQRHNPELANVAWTRGNGRTLAGVRDASADGVFSHVVFQHIPDPAITLNYVAEMGRVLRPGGWAAFQMSNDAGVHRRRLWSRWPDRHAAWRGSAVSIPDLTAAAAAASLRVVRVVGEGTQFCLVLLERAGGDA